MVGHNTAQIYFISALPMRDKITLHFQNNFQVSHVQEGEAVLVFFNHFIQFKHSVMASTSIDAALSTQNIEIHYTNIAKLIDIEYPGKIVDPEKALSTLGGLKNLTKVGMDD